MSTSRPLSIAIEAPANRLIWLCEGLTLMHTPARPEHRAMTNAAKAARKLATSNNLALALQALDGVLLYASKDDSTDERDAVERAVLDVRRAIEFRLSARQREREQ